jgi:hypothetical protein
MIRLGGVFECDGIDGAPLHGCELECSITNPCPQELTLTNSIWELTGYFQE